MGIQTEMEISRLRVEMIREFTKKSYGRRMKETATGNVKVCNGLIISEFGGYTRFFVTGYVQELSSDVDIMLIVYRDTGFKQTSCHTSSSLRSLMEMESTIFTGDELHKHKPPMGWEWC